MAGHSKRHNIKHKKAAEDAKKSKVYSKIAKLIEIAARSGADPMMNPALDTVLQKAKYNSVPKDVIEKAIKKGSGEKWWANYVTIFYEWYGPGWVALYIKTMTDNSNRTSTNIRSMLNKFGASMAEVGSVSRQFVEKWEIIIDGVVKTEIIKWNEVKTVLPFDNDQLENQVLELDIEDYAIEDGVCRVITSKNNFIQVRNALESLWYNFANADLIWTSTNQADVSDEDLEKIDRIVELIEDDDDVEQVYLNID